MEEFFVPGRVCIIGEHIDWASLYAEDTAIERSALILPTNQGLKCKARKAEKFTIISGDKKICLDMNEKALKDQVNLRSFFSYAAGVALEIMKSTIIGGIELEIECNLPIKKGLSSSAAVCVAVARAFNTVYKLRMDFQREADFAFKGERLTGSQCGKMDQMCAYGKPLVLNFAEDRVTSKPLTAHRDLFFVVVDIGGSKDTQEILNSLLDAFKRDKTNSVRTFLETKAPELVRKAKECIEQGKAEELGHILQQYQEGFDEYLMPACRQQLEAPILHKILNEEKIKPFIFGGKSIGSGGEGSAVFLVKDEEAQQKVMKIMKHEFQKECWELSLSSKNVNNSF